MLPDFVDPHNLSLELLYFCGFGGRNKRFSLFEVRLG